MANLIFQKVKGVIDAPLSFLGWEGETGGVRDVDLALQEYMIICGDIGVDAKSRDEKLEELRKEMAAKGHTIEIREVDHVA